MRASFPMMLMMSTGFVCLSFRFFFSANNTWMVSSANPFISVNRIFTYITIELPTGQHRARFFSSDIIMRLNETWADEDGDRDDNVTYFPASIQHNRPNTHGQRRRNSL